MLLFRLIVNYSDYRWTTTASLALPLSLEHGDDLKIKILLWTCQFDSQIFPETASPLSLSENGIEERTASIGIDFNQQGPGFGKMRPAFRTLEIPASSQRDKGAMPTNPYRNLQFQHLHLAFL